MPTIEDIVLKAKSDPRDTEALIAQALAKDMDADDQEFWDPVRILQYRLKDTFPRIHSLIQRSDSKSREVAATILGQNLVKDKQLTPECTAAIAYLLKAETDSSVLSSAIFALGNLKGPAYVESILPYSSHPDPDVRYAVAHSLPVKQNDKATQAMVALSRDDDFGVRNWATFGLRNSIDFDFDTEEIRQALLDRIQDSEEEIRGEAFLGLVERRDTRIIEPLRIELAKEKLFPEIRDCIDKLIADKQNYDALWQPIFNDLHHLNRLPLIPSASQSP